MKVAEPVKSPTFVLMTEYHGRLTLYHADLYRLNDPGEVADLALEEVAGDGVLIVEWPDRAWAELPPEHLLVRLQEKSARERSLTLIARGARYEQLIRELGGQ
jgi:tRNA threonylcarbamoyladenosine biosynthesis protein TsaE